MISKLRKEMRSLHAPKEAKFLAGFFKTGKGQYAEGDVFLGITVPDSRKIAKKYKSISLNDTVELLKSKFHEERLVALLILIHKYSASTEVLSQKKDSADKSANKEKRKIFELYLKNTKYVNNWDLVDTSASKIIGDYLFRRSHRTNKHHTNNLKFVSMSSGAVLRRLAKSKNLWERRIAIVATHAFIKGGKFKETFEIAKLLLYDDHDLIHKAVGWMLREVGNRDRKTEEKFLKKHYKKMPRTMLRYAIEKFPEPLRQKYLKGKK